MNTEKRLSLPRALLLPAALFAALPSLSARAGPAKPPPAPGIDQTKVDAAIDKGTALLLAKVKAAKDAPLKILYSAQSAVLTADEITLYTLALCNTNERTPEFKTLLDRVLKRKQERVYQVAFKALALEAIDPGRFQPEIADCAQFLIDNQCENGQWGYGAAVPDAPVVRTPGARKPAGGKEGTKALPVIALQKRRKGPASGDNSNTQYALLGLRSCLMAGIRFPPEVFADAEKWWEKDQNKDGGWGYGMKEMSKPREESYASMTAGAVGSLAICRFYLGLKPEASAAVQGGLAWLAKNWSLTEIKGYKAEKGVAWVFYHDYATERLGAFLQKEDLAGHPWYPEGAAFLIRTQKADGSWTEGDDVVPETCFAILFLRRATKPLRMVFTEK